MSNHNIQKQLWPLAIPIDEVHQDPSNARIGHDVDKIAASLALYGQVKPIVVNAAENGRIIAGNGTHKAAKQLGWDKIAVVQVEFDPTTATGYGIADNRLSELSEWDHDILNQLIASIDQELELETGFTETEIERMIHALEDFQVSDTDYDTVDVTISEADQLMIEWQTKSGQLWRIPSSTDGHNHYLICGDCTDENVVKRLMSMSAKDENGDNKKAVMMNTDPPYLIDYDGTNKPDSKERERQNIKDWSESPYHDWDSAASPQAEGLYDGFFTVALEHALIDNPALYCWHAYKRLPMLLETLKKHNILIHQQIIWQKNISVFGYSWYRNDYEPCVFGWVQGKKPARMTNSSPETVWQFNTLPNNERPDHPTPKPFELFTIPIEQHTRKGDIVFEPKHDQSINGHGSRRL